MNSKKLDPQLMAGSFLKNGTFFPPQKANNLNVCYSKKVTQLRSNRLFCRCQSTLTK